MTTFLSIAENRKVDFLNFSCNSMGKLEQIDDEFFISEIIFNTVATIEDEKDRELVERILQIGGGLFNYKFD